MKYARITITLLALLAVGLPALAAQTTTETMPAFPGAEGAGAGVSGGRGGEVYVVTNLNREGPGSLADAVSAPNRIVVFAVSGAIDLTKGKGDKLKGGKLAIDAPNITILGQTAPGDGICLTGGALSIAAENIILRYLRVRRGYIAEGDMGDAIEIKPPATGKKAKASGESQDVFEKIRDKKIKRGKELKTFAPLAGIIIDHCSASWATDENLTMTHADRSTVQWSIAAEGLDYTNPRQTPPNHSEGSLWGSAAPGGVSSMHHMLYAHNRLRNPRTTGGPDVPPVLTMWNSVVYDWSEFATHTGSERVLINVLNNTYQPGPSTPPELRAVGFTFCGDPLARLFIQGNAFTASPEATRDNRLGVAFQRKLNNLGAAERSAMIAAAPLGPLPQAMQPAREAWEAVLNGAGATLPARDAVDRRIIESVRSGGGKIIEKESDLPAADRALVYHTLPPPADSDHDGLPDFWERQFGLNPNDPADSARPGAGGYANIEHYANNTDPTGRGGKPIVHVAAIGSRASAARGRDGAWRVSRGGDLARPLAVKFELGGDVSSGTTPEATAITIPAGQREALLPLRPQAGAKPGSVVTLALTPGQDAYNVGCPAQALIAIE